MSNISLISYSRINYTYKWQSGNIHLEEIQVYEGNLFKNFPEDSISVKCDFHMLLARYDSIFTIVVNFTDPSIRPGTYRCKLRLYLVIFVSKISSCYHTLLEIR